MRLILLWLIAALLGGCPGGGGGGGPDPEPRPGSDLSGFADLDGFAVSAAPGRRGTARLFDPRTGGRGGVLEVATALVSEFAPSPDGRTLAAFGGGSERFPRLHVFEIVAAGETHDFAMTHRVEVSASGTAVARFDDSGRWLYGDDWLVDVETGVQRGCEGASAVQPLPGGRHVAMSCDTGQRLPRAALYRDGELVWIADRRLAGGHTQDGQWLCLDRGALHVPSLTVVEGAACPSVEGLFESPDGRLGSPVTGRTGSFCRGPGGALPEAGELISPNLPGEPRTDPLPLGAGGAFLEIPEGHGLTVHGVGFDATGDDFIHIGALTQIELRRVERCDCVASGCVCVGDNECHDVLVETRVRRAAVDGSRVRDLVFPAGHFAECTPSPHEPTPSLDPQLSIVTGPDGSFVCPRSALARARRWVSTHVGRESATELFVGGRIFSPGRRATITDIVFGPDTAREATACLERIDRPGERACAGAFDFAVEGNEFLFWTGWAADGAGGHAGAVVYRASRRSAPVGEEVTLFGAGLGAGGTVRIGDFDVPASDVVAWSDTEIVLTMPAGAPTEPGFVTVAGGPGPAEVAVPTLHATRLHETSLRVPERVVAPRGSVFIPVEGSTAPDALTFEMVDFYDPGGDALAPNPYTIQRVPGGFVFEVADPQPIGVVAATVSDGVEARTVFLDIDGSVQPFDDQWVTRHHGLSPLHPAYRILDLAGHLVIPSNDRAHLVLPDGSTKPIVDFDYAEGTWTHGVGEPHVLYDDGGVRRVDAWNTAGLMARPEPLPLVTRLDMGHMGLLTAANPRREWAVHPPAGAGMFFSLRTCGSGCQPDHTIRLSDFRATPLDSPDRENLLDVLSGPHPVAFEALDLTTMRAHVYSGEAASFGEPRFQTPTVARGRTVALDDALVVLSDDGRVLIHAGLDAAGTWTAAGIEGGMTLGAVSDGALALVGTDTGEVFTVDSSGATESLGSVPGWDAHGAESVGHSQIAGNDTMLLWLVEVANPRVYLRARPR